MDAPHPRRLALAVVPLIAGVGLALGLAASASSDAGGDGRDDPDEPGRASALAQKSTGSRMMGQVMQCPPPRPRPSSAPTMVITSTPALRSRVLVRVLRS